MGDEETPKPRAPAFTDGEIAILLTCLDQYKGIIESTVTDSYSLREKKDAWQNVTAEYEDICLEHDIYTTRSTEHLKACWKNVKAKVRKIDSGTKTEAMMTGGGPGHIIDPSDEALVSMVHKIEPTIDFTLQNDWDSTAAFEVSETVDLTTENEPNTEDESQRFSFDADDVNEFFDGDMHNSDNDDQSKEVQDSRGSELRSPQPSTSRKMIIDDRNEKLANDKKEALARKRGFCKPAASSFKNRNPAKHSIGNNSYCKVEQTNGAAQSTPKSFPPPHVKRNKSKPKLTTSQKLVSLARDEALNNVNAGRTNNCESGILENHMKECKGNFHSEDEYERPAKKRKVTWAEAEQAEKIQRAEEGRQQRAEFHQGRMEIIAREKLYWDIKNQSNEARKGAAAEPARQ
ncbi:hypothetical protein QAD02_002449 [Eretmocerus hayati]|uniref:Uncharacterized protein n=1 Tax=Eretmocerus hayati TaxID=131215 RepID=A0ACC2NNS1_9HYME|nr:hypothetical protein QAD02_002449 [Eretmocerus hayati]